MCGRLCHFIFTGLLLSSLAAAGCGSPPPPEQPKPAEPAAPAVDAAAHMHEHLARVSTMLEAVTRGDIEGAAEPGRWIADHQELAGLPAGQDAVLADMRKSAAVVAEAKDLKNAATATAMVVSYCGTCHAAAKVSPAIAEALRPAAPGPLAAHMLEHQAASDLLYQGLVMPSDERWQKGLASMQGAPLTAKDFPKDAKLTNEVVALEKRVHEMAGKAKATADIGSKVAFYGEYLSGCAGCHGLHGKLWGPGLPKT